MSGFAVLFTFVLWFVLLRKKDFREIVRYYAIGLLVAFIDFVFEYMGTSTGHWKYNESLYFILGLIPIELVFLFFSAGVILRFISLNMNKIRIPVKANAIFYILILVAFLLWVRQAYMESETSMLPLAIVVGLWGISNISDRNKEAALVLGVVAVLIDFIAEIVIIESGSYDYRVGFSLSIALIYGLYTIGLLAVMERLYKLDRFLDQRVVRKFLRLFGIYRKKALKELEKDKDKLEKILK